MANILESKIIITGFVEFLSGLHLGGGTAENEITDNAVIRDFLDRPYIPGSSFKGVFRSTVEKIAANFNYDVCSSGNFESCPTQDRNNKKYETACDSCKLFGSNVAASKIFFSDMTLNRHKESWQNVSEIRDGVAIDRDSERAVDKQKYDYEVIPSGIKLDFEIIAENLDESEKGLLAIGLMEFQSGAVTLGGLKSRGLGKCKLHIEGIDVIDYKDLDKLKKFYMSGKKEKVFAAEVESTLKTWIAFVN